MNALDRHLDRIRRISSPARTAAGRRAAAASAAKSRKVDAEKAAIIKDLAASGEWTQVELARAFDVSPSLISLIISGKRKLAPAAQPQE